MAKTRWPFFARINKSFYETYCTLMNNRAIAYPNRLHKADSLIQKNCTPEFTDAFRLEQREGVGFDTLEIIDLTDTYLKFKLANGDIRTYKKRTLIFKTLARCPQRLYGGRFYPPRLLK